MSAPGRSTLGRILSVVLGLLAAVTVTATPSGAEEDPVVIRIEEGYGREGLLPTFVEFRASLSRPASAPVSFSYSTPTNACLSIDGYSCAYGGTDYLDTAGTVVFAPGETTKTFVVPILTDLQPEGVPYWRDPNQFVEYLVVDLWAPVNGVFAYENSGGWAALAAFLLDWFVGDPTGDMVAGLSGNAWGAIADDDAGLLVEEPGDCFLERSTNSTIGVTVRLSAPSQQTVAVNYSTRDGSAKAGSDYKAVQGKLSFAPGELRKTVPVSIIGDRKAEYYYESFIFELSNPAGAAFHSWRSSAYLCIYDDDA